MRKDCLVFDWLLVSQINHMRKQYLWVGGVSFQQKRCIHKFYSRIWKSVETILFTDDSQLCIVVCLFAYHFCLSIHEHHEHRCVQTFAAAGRVPAWHVHMFKWSTSLVVYAYDRWIKMRQKTFEVLWPLRLFLVPCLFEWLTSCEQKVLSTVEFSAELCVSRWWQWWHMMARWTWIAWDTGVPEKNIKDGKVNHQNINEHVFSLLWDPTNNFENVWRRQRLGICCLKNSQTPKIVMLAGFVFNPQSSPHLVCLFYDKVVRKCPFRAAALQDFLSAEIALTSSLKKRLQTWQLSSCRCDSMAQCQPQMRSDIPVEFSSRGISWS